MESSLMICIFYVTEEATEIFCLKNIDCMIHMIVNVKALI